MMGKIAIITGSSGGIGKALVNTYLEDNYTVIGLDRASFINDAALPAAKNFIMLDADLLLFSKNLSYREGLLNKVKGCLPEKYDALVIINNAAEQILKPIADINWMDWEISLAVNSAAPFFLTQGLVKELSASRGHVVNISSIHAKLTKPNFTCYAVSKAAVEGVTRSLAIELSPLGISVNALAPAAIATEMLRAGFVNNPEKLQELEAYHPSQSIGKPSDVAHFIKSITDHRSGFLSGSVLKFDGGISNRLHDPD